MERPSSVKALIAITSICILLFCGLAHLSQAAHIQVTKSEKQTEVQSEYKAYSDYFDAYANNDFHLAAHLARKYLLSYPNGLYADALRMWLPQMITRLAEKGETEDENFLAFIQAVKSGQTEVIESMLEQEMDANARRTNGQTVLMVAASNGQAKVVKLLIQRGADVNAKEDKFGWSALVFAIWKGDSDTVQALLDNGADTNLKDRDDVTLLQHAIMSRHPEMIKLFKKIGIK